MWAVSRMIVITMALLSGQTFARLLRAKSKALVATELNNFEKNKQHLTVTTKEYVCTQIDANFYGGVIGVSGSVAAEVEFTAGSGSNAGEIKLTGLIGCGFSLSAVIIKGSAYVQASLSLHLPVPTGISAMKGAVAYAMGVVYDGLKKSSALGRLLAKGKGFFAQLRTGSKAAVLEKFTAAKAAELSEATYNVDKYTPWACSLPWRGFGVEETPERLPDDPSCKRKAAAPFTNNLPANYLICPSRSLQYEKCSYFCPSTEETLLAYNNDGKGSRPEQPRNQYPPCPRIAGAITPREDGLTVPSRRDPAKRKEFCDRHGGCGYTEENIAENKARTIAEFVRSDGNHKIGKIYSLVKKHKSDIEEALKKTGDKAEKAYINIMERIMKEVYFTGQPVAHAVGQGMTGYVFEAAPTCQGGVANSHGMNPIRPLMCIFMKYGYLLDDFTGSASGTNEHVRLMIYKLLPALIVKNGNTFDKVKSKAALDHLWSVADPLELLSPGLGGEGADQEDPLALDKIYQVSMFLALSTEDMLPHIEAHLAESKAKQAADELEKTESNCKKVKWSGSRSFGVTVGGSTVGFCTPDTNPFQFLRSRSVERRGEWKGGKCVTTWEKEEQTTEYIVAGSIYFQFAMVTYRGVSSTGSDRGYRFSFRLPLNTGESAFTTAGQAPSTPDPLVSSMKDVSDWLGDHVTTVNGLEKFEQFIAGLFTKIVDATSGVRDNGVLQALGPTISGSCPAKQLIQAILHKLPNVNPLSSWADGNSEQLLGFDIERRRGESKKTIRIVYHSYTWAQGTIPSPIPTDPSMTVTLTGSSGTEKFFEFEI